MPETRLIYDDAIDPFEFFETLWNGKWIIVAFVVLATLIGFGYSQVAQPKYDISVPVHATIYPVLTHQICEPNNQDHQDWRASDCLADGTLTYFIERLDIGWSVSSEGNSITYTTLTPSSVNTYENALSDALNATNEALRSDAISELAIIESLANDSLLNTERVATNVLNAKRVVQSIDNGQSALILGPVSVVKSAPKMLLILTSSVVLGVMIGVFFILVRNAIRKRKQQLPNG